MKKTIIAILSIALLLLFSSPMLLSTAAQPPKHGIVYTEDNAISGNNVLAFETGPDGSLTPSGTFATGGLGSGTLLHSQGAVVLTQDQRWLLAVDAGSNQITVFHVGNDGSLSSPFSVSSHGTMPISLTVYHDWVYVLDAGSGNIAGFVLSDSGKLTFITGSNQPLVGGAGSSPEQVGFGPHGNTIYATDKGTNTINEFAVDDGVAGPVTPIPSNGGGPYGFAFTNNGYLILSEAGGKSASSYAVSEDGSLRTISGAIPDFAGTPCWIAVTNDGRFAYVGNGGGGLISGYSISEQGTLSLFSSIAARTTGAASLDLAFGGNNQHLFALSGPGTLPGTAYINSYQTYPDGGISAEYSVAIPGTAAGLAAA